MIIYTGAEIGSNRTVLESMGVKSMGVSFARILKRGMPKTKKWLVADRFETDALVVAYPGVSETKNFGAQELEDFAAAYQGWVVDNADRLQGFVEFDPPQLGHDWVLQQRAFWEEAGDQFWPVWNHERGYPDLMELGNNFANVGITYAGVESNTNIATHTRALAYNTGVHLHGLGIASPENLRQVPFTSASTGAWQSGMRRGETIVWDGTRLVRYPSKMKEQARRRYKARIEQAGLDYEAIIADDPKAVTRLAIWSYQRLEENMSKKKPGNNPFQIVEGGGKKSDVVDENNEEVNNSDDLVTSLGGMLFGDVDNSTEVTRKPQGRIPAPRDPQERQYLPVLNVSTKTIVEVSGDGTETLRDVPILSSTGVSLRQCNTCFVASNCPAFKDDSECAFGLPVEVKTKDQMLALLNAIIEMQGSRVAFARFSEELNGGYPDPNVSQEIDRLFKLVEQLKKMEDNKEFVRMTFERSGGAGVLSSIFGDRAQVLKELDGGPMRENETTMLIKQSLEQ